VILHDALVNPAILALASPTAYIVDVGKRYGRKKVTQEEINCQLIEFALQGQLVVRLKSGDPLVFGRAGEELLALREAHIDTEVVPGITSAVAAAATAQISLTDRRYADQVVLISAHRAEDKVAVDWNGMVTPRTTVVVYTPGEYGKVAEKLIATGMDGNTPCLVISRISSSEECRYRTTLGQLSAVAVRTPSLLIIGDVVGNNACAEGYRALPFQAERETRCGTCTATAD
jgi:uroporphyrin-III C-methyltransferase